MNKLTLPKGQGGGMAPSQHPGVTVPGQVYTREQLEIIKATVMPPNSTDFEVAAFLTVCSQLKLDPFARQIYAIRRKGKIVPQVSIDAYVTIAQRTGKYAGRSLPEWNPMPGKADFPNTCVVWVYSTNGGKAPGFVIYTEHAPQATDKGEDFMWRSRPFEQLEKCAFAKALRALFGADTFGNTYVEGEVPADEVPQGFHVESRPEDEPKSVPHKEVQPEEPAPTPQSDDEERRVAEWELALSQCDRDLLKQHKTAIAAQVDQGLFGLPSIEKLRAATQKAQGRLR